MDIPEGMTEKQILDAIEKAVNILSPSFVFGHYSLDDIKQEARMFGLQALPRYDPSRPWENFVYSHIRNRLCNLKRDRYRRNDPPCSICHTAVGNVTEHEDGQYCKKYLEWKRRNDSKQRLMKPLDLEHIADEGETNTHAESEVEGTAQMDEILGIIDDNLDIELRATYLQMRAGQKVPKSRRVAVENAVKEILRDYQCLNSNADD